MAYFNIMMTMDRNTIDEVLSVEQEGIEYDLDTEIGAKYEAIIEKALSYDGFVLTDTIVGYRNGWRDEYEALIDAWRNFCGAVVRHAAEEVLGE